MIIKIFKAFVVAFSMYSKIPMPRFEWASDDMKYHLCFFPWVGAVIGGLELFMYYVSVRFFWGSTIRTCIALVIPLLVTGGFHVDGFMDTMDAIHSYQPKEKKLEILKDPHIGAFSVISLLIYFLVAMGFVSELYREEAAIIIASGFFMSRALSGLSLMYMKNAKNNGMLNTSTTTADKKTVRVLLWIQIIICAAFMIWINWQLALLAFASFGACYLYYYRMSYKQFGGITGDLAGFFVCVSELVSMMAVTLVQSI